jgi:hypothetical protein
VKTPKCKKREQVKKKKAFPALFSSAGEKENPTQRLPRKQTLMMRRLGIMGHEREFPIFHTCIYLPDY